MCGAEINFYKPQKWKLNDQYARDKTDNSINTDTKERSTAEMRQAVN